MPEGKGKIYVVATPIGNLGDMTARGVEILSSVDFIAAEDTRVTGILLDRINVRTPMITYHKHNEKERSERIIQRVLGGQSCALVTDAGTPGISDPGAVLVGEAVPAGIDVVAVPGVCAVTAALSICGFVGTNYGFYGFLPKKSRAELSEILNNDKDLIVFYESPHRIIETVELIQDIQGDVNLVVRNDLTKKFERVYRGKPADVLPELKSNPSVSKGEYTVVAKKEVFITENIAENLSAEARLVDICIRDDVSLKEAQKILHERNKLTKKEIYTAALNIKGWIKCQKQL